VYGQGHGRAGAEGAAGATGFRPDRVTTEDKCIESAKDVRCAASSEYVDVGLTGLSMHESAGLCFQMKTTTQDMV
jgi:hypothetical protein